MIKNFIVSGCSFTAGSSNIEESVSNPRTWSHFLLKTINPRVFINLGIPKGSNNSIFDNLIFCLETKKFLSPDNTLIGLNLTELDRICTMCPNDHPNASPYFSWASDFGFNWNTSGNFVYRSPPFNGSLQKNIGFNNLIISSCLSVVQGINYLEQHKFPYFFMLLNNDVFDSAPVWFKDFINLRQEKWIKFGDNINMQEFARVNNTLRDDDKYHPTEVGHELISEQILLKINGII